VSGTPPRWPPDAFAVVASILQQGGAYASVVEKWPPRAQSGWAEKIRALGRRWRAVATATTPLPGDVQNWWKTVLAASHTEMDRVCEDETLCDALLELSAAADEASEGIGMRDPETPPDAFDIKANRLLALSGSTTYCDEIHPSKAVVLPKVHTPRYGLTLRSLSHHLALCAPGEVRARWLWLPFETRRWSLNLLLLPWPESVVPNDFRASAGTIFNMPDKFGLFTCDARRQTALNMRRLSKAISVAEHTVGQVDGIIFPELALRNDEHVRICQATGAFVVGGIGRAPSRGRSGQNRVGVAVPYERFVATWTQRKHHRWRIEANQIAQYGLGAQLDPEREWWEHIESSTREVNFWQLNQWLTLCVLICEDLARQDPVSNVVRAVGPNLVIALLMDGPQLESRWPAKYATVLADDPGSSVLTLTSLGMSRLSRVPGKSESRVIGLWKDARTGKAVEIEMKGDSGAVVISLTREFAEEWTADGRSDDKTTGYLCLNGVREISV
jgi:hypothetical protein